MSAATWAYVRTCTCVYGRGRACARVRGRVRQETGVVEAFIAGTRGWLRWNASRLISRNIIYRLSCPYVARTARYNTYKHTWKRAYTHARARARIQSSHDPLAGDIDSFCRQFCRHTRRLPPTKTRILAWAGVYYSRG